MVQSLLTHAPPSELRRFLHPTMPSLTRPPPPPWRRPGCWETRGAPSRPWSLAQPSIQKPRAEQGSGPAPQIPHCCRPPLAHSGGSQGSHPMSPPPRGVVWRHACLFFCVYGCCVLGCGLVDRGVYAIRRVQPLCTLTSLTLIIVVSLQIFSVLNSDDASAPALETQPQGDEEGECPRGAGWGAAGLGARHGLVLRLAWDGLGLSFPALFSRPRVPAEGLRVCPGTFTQHMQRRNLWADILSSG